MVLDRYGWGGQGTRPQLLRLAFLDVFTNVALFGGVVEDLLVEARKVVFGPVVARIEEIIAESRGVQPVGFFVASEEFKCSIGLVSG